MPAESPMVHLYLRFYGDVFDPDVITRRLGVTPTTAFRPGDPITRNGRGRRRGYGWILKVGAAEITELDKLLDELRCRVAVSGEVVKALCGDLKIEAVVMCGIAQPDVGSRTALVFPAEFAEWVVGMGAAIDIDVV